MHVVSEKEDFEQTIPLSISCSSKLQQATLLNADFRLEADKHSYILSPLHLMLTAQSQDP